MSNNKIDDMMRNVTMSDTLKSEILNKTVHKQKVVSMSKRHSVKRLAIVAAVCVSMLGTLTVVAANNAGKWQKYFADIFGVDEKEQQKLLDDGYAQDKEVNRHEGDILTVTQNGITITVKQTIMDNSVLVILLHVKSENGVELDDKCIFGNVQIDGVSDNGSFAYTNGEMLKDTPYEKWYVISYSCTPEEGKINDGNMVDLTVSNINRLGENNEFIADNVIVEGEWKLSWTLDVNESVVEVPVNQSIDANGFRYYIGSLEITPLSLKVKYTQRKDVLDENIEYADGDVMCYNEETGMMELSYAGPDIDFVMKDGTVYENMAGHYGTFERVTVDVEGEEMDMWNLPQIIDIEELESVIIEGQEFSVIAQ